MRSFARGSAVLAAVACAGCPLQRPASHPPATDQPRLVVAEKGPAGGRLEIVDETGARLADLTTRADGVVRDVSPAFSPDGRWIAFASTRGRELTRSSLWVVAAAPRSEPVRLTTGDAVELSPVWTPAGDAVVFAANRDGDFDLWRLPVIAGADGVQAAGEPERLTDEPGEELSPSIAADGRIAFTEVTRGAAARSWIRIRQPDGAIEDLTAGPADSGPAWTPDGDAVAFTAPHLRDGEPATVDGDLWRVDAAGGAPSLLVDAPATDESGPAWSSDGRWLFATSIYRAAATGDPLFAAVVVVDLRAATPVVRMLVDPAGAVPRLSIAVARGALDGAALAAAPVYLTELHAILERAVTDAAPPADAPTR